MWFGSVQVSDSLALGSDRETVVFEAALPCRWALQLSGSLRLLSDDTLGSCCFGLTSDGMEWKVGGVPCMR